jgi:hypothetical protein
MDTTVTPVMPRQLAVCLPTRQPWRRLLIDAQGRYLGSPEGFLQVRGFDSEPVGGVFYSAAQALDGRWGFIDTSGIWRVHAEYEDLRNAAPNGMARFRQNGLWGYIRMDGVVLVAARFEEARPFRHGVAAVKLPGKGWRFIDESGEFTSSREHDELGEMGAEGLAWAGKRAWAVKGGQRRVGFVDREGRWVIEPNFGYAKAFGDHAVTAATLDYDHYGLIDTRGQWVLEPQKNWRIEHFDEDGLACFLVAKGNHERGFINTQGQVCIPSGRNVGEHRACGLARAWTQYYRADGERMEPAARLCMASDFRPEARVAIVRLDNLKAHGDQPAQERNWALLHTDGRIVPMPPHLREPLSDADDRLHHEYLNTPWVTFIDHAGDLVWVDGEFQEQARVRMAAGQASLHTAAGEVWSTTAEGLGPVQAYYAPHTAQVLEAITEMEGVSSLAAQLCATIEERLHQTAAGQTLEPMPGKPDDEEEDWEDDEDEPDDDGDEGRSASDPDWRGTRRETRRMAHLLRAERRLSRYYLGETHGADDEFLTSEWSDHSAQLHDALRQLLSDRYGPPDVLPEWAGWQDSHQQPVGWAVPLSRPLPGDDGRLTEHRQLWVCLHHASDSGDGDVWWENWLLVAPSVDALALALRARAGQPGIPPAADAAANIDLVSRHPEALQALPRELLSDAVIDAALNTDTRVIRSVPKRLMTTARYALAVEQNRLAFTQVPAHMLDEAVCLAHVGNSGWRLREVPEHLRTTAVCLSALRRSPSAREHVPPAILQELLGSGVDIPDPAKRAAELKASVQETLARSEKLLADPFIKLMTEKPDKPFKRVGHALRLGGWVMRNLVFARSQEAAVHRGLTGWLERRPVAAVMTNAIVSILAILCHVLVTIEAWQLEGWVAALATGLLFGIAELYWVWRAFFGATPDIGLGLTALLPVLYILIWVPVYQRIARVYARRVDTRT